MPTAGDPDKVLEAQKLFVKHSSAIRRFIVSLVPDFDLADDILQEVFVVVTEKAHTFKTGSSFRAWANTIARNKLMNAQKKYRSHAKVLAPATFEALCQDMPEPQDTEQVDALKACIGKLAPRAEQVTRLRYHEHQSPSQIAKALGWTREAVYVALSRARTFLRHCIEKQMETND